MVFQPGMAKAMAWKEVELTETTGYDLIIHLAAEDDPDAKEWLHIETGELDPLIRVLPYNYHHF